MKQSNRRMKNTKLEISQLADFVNIIRAIK
jgi:hypothetical protein